MDINIGNWKGQDIVNFQEDLLDRVKSSVSEKWFYTHIKAKGNKLPRIDMLNILSKYCGYIDWADFKNKHIVTDLKYQPPPRKGKQIGILITVGLIIAAGLWLVPRIASKHSYRFCFIDADRQQPIKNGNIHILLLNEGESPIHIKADSNGCFEIISMKDKISFVVKAPYFKQDTIIRILNRKGWKEQVRLRTNDYALMIHYFSTSKVTDWKKRRKQLDGMIADNAKIYQVYGRDGFGLELYNKQEFINKLTTPVRSLNNIEIIETIYTGDKISMMKFIQADD